MSITKIVTLRSSCLRRQVGAIIVKENRIISTGYNGTPRGIKNCDEGGCPRGTSKCKSGECSPEGDFCNHAEENAILQAAFQGSTPLRGSIIYTTLSPCSKCAIMIIQSGIKELVYLEKYSVDVDKKSRIIFQNAKITYRKFKEKIYCHHDSTT